MLIVRRRAGEAILVAGEIEIEVIEISRTRVKLGIRAPRSVSVLRLESVALAQQNQSAAALLTSLPETVDDLVRLLGNVGANPAKVIAPGADM